jgi:hypothetical protein
VGAVVLLVPVLGHDKRGAIVLRQKWSRGQVEAYDRMYDMRRLEADRAQQADNLLYTAFHPQRTRLDRPHAVQILW